MPTASNALHARLGKGFWRMPTTTTSFAAMASALREECGAVVDDSVMDRGMNLG